jgi:hypothetical protein
LFALKPLKSAPFAEPKAKALTYILYDSQKDVRLEKEEEDGSFSASTTDMVDISLDIRPNNKLPLKVPESAIFKQAPLSVPVVSELAR